MGKDPFYEVRKLLKRVLAEAKELGLEVEMYNIQPGIRDVDTDSIAFLFNITPEALKTKSEREQELFDQQFANIESNFLNDISKPTEEDVERAKRHKNMAEEMKGWLDET